MNRLVSAPRVVLDTNILLVALTSHSRWHIVYQALCQGLYTLVVSNDIVSEYAEKSSTNTIVALRKISCVVF
jgi:predicted nucleic acid-binding protein